MKKILLTLFLFFLLSFNVFGASISTLTDDFNDNSINTAKWSNSGGAQIAETNQELELTTTTSGGEYYMFSYAYFDLTGSQASIKVVDAGNQVLASYAFIPVGVWASGTNKLLWNITGGNIQTITGATVNTTDTYVAATFRYLRIREAAGTVYFDYSADGLTWTNKFSLATPAWTTNFLVLFDIISTAEASATTAKIDDFNILPSATTGASSASFDIDDELFNGGINQ